MKKSSKEIPFTANWRTNKSASSNEVLPEPLGPMMSCLRAGRYSNLTKHLKLSMYSRVSILPQFYTRSSLEPTLLRWRVIPAPEIGAQIRNAEAFRGDHLHLQRVIPAVADLVLRGVAEHVT